MTFFKLYLKHTIVGQMTDEKKFMIQVLYPFHTGLQNQKKENGRKFSYIDQ